MLFPPLAAAVSSGDTRRKIAIFSFSTIIQTLWIYNRNASLRHQVNTIRWIGCTKETLKGGSCGCGCSCGGCLFYTKTNCQIVGTWDCKRNLAWIMDNKVVVLPMPVLGAPFNWSLTPALANFWYGMYHFTASPEVLYWNVGSNSGTFLKQFCHKPRSLLSLGNFHSYINGSHRSTDAN